MKKYADSIVFGAAGFIGRSLVAELLRDGHTVAATARSAESRDRLASWLAEQGVDRTALTLTSGDITRPNLGLEEEFDGIRDVYNTAALMKFGLAVDEARRVNVTGALDVARWASSQPQLRRLVHITGYRATVDDGPEGDYRNGAYGASKLEVDAELPALAAELGVPLTIANPASVIGPGQYFGLADLVDNLWRGKLPALPGRRDTFVPVVGIDYVARFLARVASLPETAGQAYTLLDPATPDLPELARLIATHLRVPAPRFTIPVSIVRALPRALTHADPESLVFIAGDRYDTAATDRVAAKLDIAHEPVADLLRAYADGIVASRNGSAPEQPDAGMRDGTWVTGTLEEPEYVLLHGLPVDSTSWSDLTNALEAPALAADLPGLGRSATHPDALADWFENLMTPVRTRPTLVGHSLGAGPAIDFALRHPDRVTRLVLISPYFLQQRTPWILRSPLAVEVLKRLPAAKLAAQLGVSPGPAVTSAAAALRRPGVARRVIAALNAASDARHRAELTARLSQLRVPVDVIVGANDPLSGATAHPVTTIEGAGHYPQLSHPAAVAELLTNQRADSTLLHGI